MFRNDDYAIDIVLLAGYLRRIPSEVARRFSGRILNIHPALLPEFGGQGMYGMNVHRAVVESEAKVTGATIHFVNEAYDEGAILGQWRIPRRSEDNVEETAAKVRVQLEHSFQGESFGTIGVNVDVIKASWNALIEAYHYALMQHRDFVGENPSL